MDKNLKITTEFLQSINACQSGKDWVEEYEDKDPVAVIKHLVADDKWNWANWLIVRVMDYKQYVGYAIFAAEQVIDLYEKKYPADKRPREAIEAAKKCVKNPTDKNKAAADAAADAAHAAADAAYAAHAAADAAYVAYAAMKTKIINYGISLLEK